MQFSTAIVREISKNLISNAQRLDDNHDPIDAELMEIQHNKYTQTLKNLGLKTIELPDDDNLPDCVFTEDAAVVCGQKAVLTRLGHPNRQGFFIDVNILDDKYA